MKTPRPEHRSFLCPPFPRSSSLPGPRFCVSVVATWIPAGFLLVYLVSVSVTVPERLLARCPRCIYLLTLLFLPACPSSPVCPDPSWTHQDALSAPFLSPPPSPAPSSLTAAKSTGALPCFILLLLFITLRGFGLSCCRNFAAV